MCAECSAASHLIESGGVRRSAIVPEIRESERRCVLEASVDAISSVRREWVVGAIHRHRQSERRELLVSAQRLERREIAHSVVNAEVDVTSVDFADLEAIVQAGGSTLGELARERETGSISAIDINARCRPAVREQTQGESVMR